MKKAFLLICILLATISFSPSLTSARELAAIGKDARIPIPKWWPIKGKPKNLPFGCSRGKKNCELPQKKNVCPTSPTLRTLHKEGL
ncbi:hypothetical protein JCGZ_25671 [Jatropha curcas]|uniref:Uncharacterized protein n=1 Tax=Jatropha curcas TaxID=180498 RepID=A0A067JWI8_JATCU|nr:hypothetical protein JCGZ_25671 [Jatropha curcas]